MTRLTDHARPLPASVIARCADTNAHCAQANGTNATAPGREWAVVFTPADDWDEPGMRTCEDDEHARKILRTFPRRYLPAFAAHLVDGVWERVGEVRTA